VSSSSGQAAAPLVGGCPNLARFLDVHGISDVDQDGKAAKAGDCLTQEFGSFGGHVGRHDRDIRLVEEINRAIVFQKFVSASADGDMDEATSRPPL
jgi:hypothetical protein